jgi:hypothetical protein
MASNLFLYLGNFFFNMFQNVFLKSIANPPICVTYTKAFSSFVKATIFFICRSNNRWHIVHNIHKNRSSNNTNKRKPPIILGVNTIIERPSFVGWQSIVIIAEIVTKPILKTPSIFFFHQHVYLFQLAFQKKNLTMKDKKISNNFSYDKQYDKHYHETLK